MTPKYGKFKIITDEVKSASWVKAQMIMNLTVHAIIPTNDGVEVYGTSEMFEEVGELDDAPEYQVSIQTGEIKRGEVMEGYVSGVDVKKL